jgi:alcohol dehydrogenase
MNHESAGLSRSGQAGMGKKPRPTLQDPGDAIVRITTSTICGTDLHILKGDLPR